MLKSKHLVELDFFERFDPKILSELSVYAFDIRVHIRGASDVLYVFSQGIQNSHGLTVSIKNSNEISVRWSQKHSNLSGEQALDMIVHTVGIMSTKPIFRMEIFRIDMAFETSDGKRTSVSFI